MQSIPEEYIDGYVIFMGLRFHVDPRALIPRLETEELVKYALRVLQEHPEIDTIADIGTGCGIIPISIAIKSSRPLDIFATDMSEEALELARENLMFVQSTKDKIQNKGPIINQQSAINSKIGDFEPIVGRLKIEDGRFNFLHGSLLAPLIHHLRTKTPENILITANLPYVREKEINAGLTHEPRMAFLGGEETGFELYEKFFLELLAWKNRPKICHIVIEFGLWQRDIAETLFQKLGLQYSFFADLRGIERFACVELSTKD